MKIGFIFPSQSTQYVGMGKELYEKFQVVRDTFDIADKFYGGNQVSKIALEGPAELLNHTEWAQPCILTLSVAVMNLLKEYGVTPEAVGGFSLGEFSAITAAGILSFEDALKVIKVRAKAMQDAVPLGVGKMIAVLSNNMKRVDELAASVKGFATIANANSPTNALYAGLAYSMDEFHEKLDAEGIKNKVITVSVPSHCKLMLPAIPALTDVMFDCKIHDPKVPQYSGFDGRPTIDGMDSIRKSIGQTFNPVWCERIIRNMRADGIDTFIEVGPNKTYSKYVKEIAPDALSLHVDDLASLEETLKALNLK